MVELRKRPAPKEPVAPPPAAKKGRTASGPSSSTTKANTKADAKPALSKQKSSEATDSSVASKLKATVSKVKEAVAGPLATDPLGTSQPAPESAVETGETGLIPETAGTAPNTTTIPASSSITDSSIGGNGQATEPPAPNDLEFPPERGNIDSSTNTKTIPPSSSATAETATLPLSNSSVGKSLNLQTLPNAPSLTTHTGRSITISDLFSTKDTNKGVIIFTYPRASTPGCTQQVCLFRDAYSEFNAPGYTIYGLSTDSAKANTTFATKQNLQYELLCDADAVLTGMLGMKKPGNAKGTVRGVVVVDGEGKVKVWFQGGPGRTVDVVREAVGGM